jgi:hypothetical protein
LHVDDFYTTVGSAGITQSNMAQYLGAVELVVDDLIVKE